MGTYSDSKYVRARKPHACKAHPNHTIERGEKYLRYQTGQRFAYAICWQCSRSTWPDGRPVYDCAQVRNVLGLPPDITRAG